MLKVSPGRTAARPAAVAAYGTAIVMLFVEGIVAGLDERFALPMPMRASLALLCLSGAVVLARRGPRVAITVLVSGGFAVALLADVASGEVLRALGAWTQLAVLLAVVPVVSAVLIRRRYIQVVIAAASRAGALVSQIAVMVSGHVIGSVALLAVVPVLGDFLGLRRQEPRVRQHYAQLILRGFVASVAWSPSTGAMGVILIATGLRWTAMAPVLLLVGASGLLLAIGWTTVAHVRGPGGLELSDADFEQVEGLEGEVGRSRATELVGFLVVTFALILLFEFLDFATTVVVVPMVMVTTTLGLLLLTEGPARVAVTAREHVLQRMPRGAGEAGFLLSAGFLGTVLAVSGLSEVAVERILGFAGGIGVPTLVVLPLLVMAVTMFGIPPLVAVALVSGAVPVSLAGIDATLYAAVLVVGSGAALLIAPLTPTMLMVADYAGVNPVRTGLHANRVFSPVYLAVLLAVSVAAVSALG